MDVPATQEISDLVIAQLESSLSQTIPIFPKAFLRVLAKVLAGVFILLWKYAGFIFLQMFVAEATMKFTTINGKSRRPLVDWGRLIGVSDPAEATRAEHVIAINVTNQTGSLPAGTKLLDSDNNVIHETVTSVALNAPQVSVTIRAVQDSEPDGDGDGSGTIGNLDVGDTLDFAQTTAKVASTVLVTSRTVTGVDAETESSYRSRVFNTFQARPQGGAYADYREWGEGVEGVAHIYPYAGNPGEVDVYVEVDTDVDPDGIPDGAHLTAVFNAIQLNGASGKATRRPVGAAVNTIAISRVSFDVNITNLDAPDPAATLTDIETGLAEYFFGRAPFIVGLSALPREDRITEAAIAGIVDTIVSAAGGTVSQVDLLSASVRIPSQTLTKGQKAKLGTVTPL